MIRFERFHERHIPAAAEFNERLNTADVETDIRLDLNPDDTWIREEAQEAGLKRIQYVAVDDGAIRAAYKLKEQLFQINGRDVSTGMMQAPISEGLINARYKLLGGLLLFDAQKRNRNLYVLGMGGFDSRYAQLVKRANWTLWEVPFLFRVVKPSGFLRHIQPLRSSGLRRSVMDIAATLHLGDVPARVWYRVKDRTRSLLEQMEWRTTPRFDETVDHIWEQARNHYSLIARRDRTSLNHLMSPDDSRFHRLVATVRGEPIGWVVVMSNQLNGHKHFGNMKLGSLVDTLAVPGYEDHLVALATHYLTSFGAELIVTNLSADPWRRAAIGSGFHQAASNFIFGLSPALGGKSGAAADLIDTMHITRNDGDGPVNL
ncbi:MAG: hypothetical protein WDZ76_09425 [Pseudohongiellaceae bacterium]